MPAKVGPKELARRELRRKAAPEALAAQRRPALEELPEGVTRGMPAQTETEVMPHTGHAPVTRQDRATPPATSTEPGAMPTESPNSPAGAQEPTAAPIPAAADIFSSDLNKRLEAMRDPALVAVAALLGVTPSELCASLRYYRGHKGAVGRHRNRARPQPG